MTQREVYRHEATSVEGFVQQLAVCYLKNQYWFYVMGVIREAKDPSEVDAQILGRYGIARSKHVRYRNKARGEANLQYLRYGRMYLILATLGRHPFFTREAQAIRDAREVPIKFRGYSISYRGGHPSVRIEPEEFRNLKAYFRGIATTRTKRVLWEELRALPFEPYAPVRGQLFGLLGEVNRLRKAAGREPIDHSAVRFRRRICRPFEPVGGQDAAPEVALPGLHLPLAAGPSSSS